MRVAKKYLKDNKHNSLHLALKICSDICPRTLSVPRKTVCFSEQIMSADKYPSIFSRQMETVVYIFPGFSWGKLSRVMRLHQSPASENI